MMATCHAEALRLNDTAASQTVLISGLFDHPPVASFEHVQASSDGGAWSTDPRQRIFAIAYLWLPDTDGLADDPRRVTARSHPISGGRLSSQPTVSRFEDAVKRITLDLDVTEGATHGAPATHARQTVLYLVTGSID